MAEADRRFGDDIDQKSSAEYPQLKPHEYCVCAVFSGTPCSTVQLALS